MRKLRLLLGSAGSSMLSRYQRNEGGGEPSDSVQRSTAVRPMVAELGTWATGLEGGTAGGGKGLRWGGWKGGP